MRSHGGRRSNGSMRGSSRSKHPWLIVCCFGAIAFLWVAITTLLIPQELADISKSLSPHGGVRGAGGDDSADVHDWALTAERRAVPNRNRPRVEMSMDTIKDNMRSFVDELHAEFKNMQKPEPASVWELYKAATDRWLLPMDRDNQGHTLFDVRDDHSIFVSVASYRDENCPNTLTEMFAKAVHPEHLFIGLVQQNCVANCRTGVLDKGVVEDTIPDIDCYKAFCDTDLGSDICHTGNVRNFFVNEAEALGPAVARYFASKLWQGENYFMQIDAHSLFQIGWDAMLIQDIVNTPSYPQSVLSHYPPDTQVNYRDQPGYRICGADFAKSDVEYDIIRLLAGVPHDKRMQDKPCPAPFVGAGFFFAHASVLANVPFDPYVPWVFMGEEILLSLRFWTWGYDIYSPTKNVLSHFYGRRHTPKFWETVNRLFKKSSIHNELTNLIINRVKNVAGYPESSTDVLLSPTLLENLDLYGDGNVRAMEDYMDIVGLDMVSKRTKAIKWCAQCKSPYPL